MEAADPFMIIVPPIEQFTNSYLVTTPGENPIIFTNYINIIVEKSEVQGLRVDDQPVSRYVLMIRVVISRVLILNISAKSFKSENFANKSFIRSLFDNAYHPYELRY